MASPYKNSTMTVDLEYDKKKSEIAAVERTLRNIRTLILGLGPTLQGVISFNTALSSEIMKSYDEECAYRDFAIKVSDTLGYHTKVLQENITAIGTYIKSFSSSFGLFDQLGKVYKTFENTRKKYDHYIVKMEKLRAKRSGILMRTNTENNRLLVKIKRNEGKLEKSKQIYETSKENSLNKMNEILEARFQYLNTLFNNFLRLNSDNCIKLGESYGAFRNSDQDLKQAKESHTKKLQEQRKRVQELEQSIIRKKADEKKEQEKKQAEETKEEKPVQNIPQNPQMAGMNQMPTDPMEAMKQMQIMMEKFNFMQMQMANSQKNPVSIPSQENEIKETPVIQSFPQSSNPINIPPQQPHIPHYGLESVPTCGNISQRGEIHPSNNSQMTTIPSSTTKNHYPQLNDDFSQFSQVESHVFSPQNRNSAPVQANSNQKTFSNTFPQDFANFSMNSVTRNSNPAPNQSHNFNNQIFSPSNNRSEKFDFNDIQPISQNAQVNFQPPNNPIQQQIPTIYTPSNPAKLSQNQFPVIDYAQDIKYDKSDDIDLQMPSIPAPQKQAQISNPPQNQIPPQNSSPPQNLNQNPNFQPNHPDFNFDFTNNQPTFNQLPAQNQTNNQATDFSSFDFPNPSQNQSNPQNQNQNNDFLV